ncbi:hypothetical protein PLESTB_001438000 [Pleodorina starrii]|uniref:Patatin n=1 Tax=Pleodorina starrii TaxID=330485 RepID=A0A9W6BWH8_9CHLO|nr:hypothetical protein PLESTM_002011900 [Pleodorina starrii]GLC59050.1 hypothetical protein PLESTB_001438000 [Pleodorina starrii]GLC77119.1 hypothetical protein PLESTF_001886600 [Pleodorina starrii]
MARSACINSCKRAAANATQEPGFSISWPGCGIMVFWQLGVLKGLSRHVDTSLVPMLGSSSGALVTAMAACGVPPDHAAEEMQRLISHNSIRQRRLGLFGVLGDVTRTWLDNCLPSDAGALLSRRSTVLVTRLPLLTTAHITSFASKQDVLEVVMGSAHLPLLLDGNWYALCRQQPVIDGGFWWWWQRCDKSYRVAGGDAPPPSPAPRRSASDSASAAATDAAAAAAHSTPTPPALGAPLQGQIARLWPPPASPSLPSLPSPPPELGVSMSMGNIRDIDGDDDGGATARHCVSPRQAADCSPPRVMSHVGVDGAPGFSGADIGVGAAWGALHSSRGGAFGTPRGLGAVPRPSASTTPAAAAAAGTGAVHGVADLDHARVRRNLAFAAAAAAAAAAKSPLAEQPAHVHRSGDGGSGSGSGRGATHGGGGGGGASTAVLLVQPADDEVLLTGWRRYRSWRPDDMAAAWEMMRHGEAYGSGPLLRRLEQRAT